MNWLQSRLSARTWGTMALAGVVVYLALPPRDGCACGTPATARQTLKSKLRDLALQEELFFADSSHYTADLAQLFLSDSGWIAVSIVATPSGFRATARYRDTVTTIRVRAGTCVVWVGDSALAEPTVPESEPRCWVPRRPRWRFGRFGPPEPTLQ